VALAIDASSPAATTVSGVSTTPISTASFNPPAGSYLVVAFSANTASGVTPGTPTITDNLGTPLTYNLRQWKTRATAPTANGQVAIWTAPVVSGGSMIVSVTTGTASGNQQTALKVWVITGQDSVTPVGTNGKNASTSASSISQSYTGAGTGGWGFLVTCDWSALGSFTAGSGCAVDATGTVPTTQFSYAFARRTLADDTNGGSNSLNVNAAGSSTDLSWAWLEMLPPATGSVVPVYWEGRRRGLALPRLWRGRSVSPPQTQFAVPPVFPPAGVHQPRQLRGLLPRRARTVTPVPAQVVVQPPAFVPVMVRARKVITGLRRSRGFHPLGSRMPAHQQGLRPRLKLPKLTRSRVANPVPAQVVLTAPAYPPQGWRARIKVVRQARGRTAVVVPPQTAVVVATWLPGLARARTKLVKLIRARISAPVHSHAAPSASRARPKPLLRQVVVRRTRITAPPAPQVAPPARSVRIAAKVLRLVRGRSRSVVPPQIILIAPGYPPAPIRIRRTLFKARLRRGVTDGWITTVVDCHLPRPGSGLTTRPTGTTLRPTGTTGRPGAGLTVRPSTGDTPNPC
jgi:hypothetical protein